VGIAQRQRIFPVFLGLISMRQCAEMLGGTLEIKADPGNGTIVKAAVPVT
jgi:signal transduction histidine kinase